MSRLKFLSVLCTLLILLPSVTPGHDTKVESPGSPAQSSYLLRTSVIGAGGAPGESGGYKTNGTLGQWAPGEGSAAGKTLSAGFWKSGWQVIVTGEEVPVALRNELFQNYPNPFNPSTTIEYMVGEESPVEIVIFNVKGQRIRTLVSDTNAPGRHRVAWDGRNDRGVTVSTGMYFYRLRVGSFSAVKKMLLLR